MTGDAPPVSVFAQFLDDIRIEATGKAILIGQYTNGEMILPPGFPPVDRLSILITARWPRSYRPEKFGLHIEIPGQPPLDQDFPPLAEPEFAGKPETPFSGTTMQAIIQARFPPLRVGDTIDVWVKIDGHDFPAGRLTVHDKPSNGSPLFNMAAPVSTTAT